MTALTVKVKRIDHSSPYTYPSRTIEIRAENSVLLTPIRAATAYEYHAKMQVPTANTIESPIMIDVRRIGAVDLHNLLNKNETYSNMIKKVELNRRLGQYAKIRLTMFQPTKTPYRKKEKGKTEEKKPSAMAQLRTSKTREQFLRFIIKMQIDSGADLITIPFIDLPFSEIRPMVRDINRDLTKRNLQPIFFVDLKYAAFRPFIELLIDKLESTAIGLIYKPYREAAVNYDLISQYYDRDVAFISANTNRYDRDFEDVSTMHYLPFYGNDVYSIARPPSIIPEDARPHLQSIRFFNRADLRVRPATVLHPESILHDFEDKDRDVLGQILRNANEVEGNLGKWRSLSYLSKVHELNASLTEFLSLQKFIEQSDSKDYVKEKPIILKVLGQAKTRSTTLNGHLNR